MKPALLIRADASATIGTGHVMRCIALAQAWQDAGGSVRFVCAELPDRLEQRLKREGFDLTRLEVVVGSAADAAASVAVATQSGAEWLAIDGYRFTPEYYLQVRSADTQILSIDDIAHLGRYPVDAVLNQNPGAREEMYSAKCDPEVRLLLGLRHVLLRREFRVAGIHRAPVAGRALRVLVTFGGSDAENYSTEVLKNLARGNWRIEIRVLAGAANRHVEVLRALMPTLPFPGELRFAADNVADEMAWADVAITAAGSTVWELASMKVPALVGASEENQLCGLPALRDISGFRAWRVEELLSRDLGNELGELMARSAAFRDVDLEGAARVVSSLRALTSKREALSTR